MHNMRRGRAQYKGGTHSKAAAARTYTQWICCPFRMTVMLMLMIMMMMNTNIIRIIKQLAQLCTRGSWEPGLTPASDERVGGGLIYTILYYTS